MIAERSRTAARQGAARQILTSNSRCARIENLREERELVHSTPLASPPPNLLQLLQAARPLHQHPRSLQIPVRRAAAARSAAKAITSTTESRPTARRPRTPRRREGGSNRPSTQTGYRAGRRHGGWPSRRRLGSVRRLGSNAECEGSGERGRGRRGEGIRCEGSFALRHSQGRVRGRCRREGRWRRR